jgi:hypothetical protein
MMKFLIALMFICGVQIIFAQEKPGEKPLQEEDEIYNIYSGKIIRKIDYRLIDVSGPSVDEKNGSDTSWISDLINSLHYTSRDWVAKNYLLFKSGDILDPFEVSESERLLRENGFFLDAKINLYPVPNTDSVDVRVVTKDRWTLILQLSFDAEKNSYAGIKDDNFLGLGHRIDGTVTHDKNPYIGWGSKLIYTSHNTMGTFTDATAGYELNQKSSIQFLDLSRPFVSLRTHFAGGLNISWNSNKLIYFSDNSVSVVPYSNFSTDVWAGYSFPAFFGPSVFRSRTNIILSAGITRSKYYSRPYVSVDSNRIFSNNLTYLFSTGIINRRFYRDHFVQRFGPTEDIPIGGMINYTGGIEVNEFSERYYSGIEGVFSRRIQDFGYLSVYSAIGGYYRKSIWEQNVFNLDLLYHSRLFEDNNWKWRFFGRNSYVIGTNRYDNEQVYLDTENGLRGHDQFALRGISKALFNFEARVFSPFQPLGFSIGVNFFSDFGFIADKGEKIYNSKIYQSYGTGLRFTNESISQAQFEVAVVFMPYTPAVSKGTFGILFSSTLISGSRLFNFLKPTVIRYGEN